MFVPSTPWLSRNASQSPPTPVEKEHAQIYVELVSCLHILKTINTATKYYTNTYIIYRVLIYTYIYCISCIHISYIYIFVYIHNIKYHIVYNTEIDILWGLRLHNLHNYLNTFIFLPLMIWSLCKVVETEQLAHWTIQTPWLPYFFKGPEWHPRIPCLVESLQSNHPGYLTQGLRKIHMFPEKGLEGNFIFQL